MAEKAGKAAEAATKALSRKHRERSGGCWGSAIFVIFSNDGVLGFQMLGKQLRIVISKHQS